MNKKICFFGLLHIKHGENNKLNFQSKNKDYKIMIYLKNAILLDQQLQKYDLRLTLLTNRKKYLENILKKLNFKLEIKSLNFKTYVPKNTHFYSCHFRVDIFKYFSTLKNTYSILIDLDVLILNNLKFLNDIDLNKAYVNDITDNVLPAYGRINILKNLKTLDNNFKNFKWYGGDFFGGNCKFYKILHSKTYFYQKKFVKNIKKLSNQTDELFISAALNNIKFKKLYKIEHTGRNMIFTRYWNTNVKHKQKKLSFYKKYQILHIPADKLFLSKCFDNFNKQINFKSEYFNYVESSYVIFKNKISKYLPQTFKNFLKNV